LTRHDQERRQRILDCIARTVEERGYPPSVREIADAVGLASTSAVHHHLIALERDGLLERGTHSSRALRLINRPTVAPSGPRRPADAGEVLEVPASMEARPDSYVLRVRGKSMIDALIDDGDFVIVQPQATARDGDIVVALLEDNGVTLKRYFREKDRIRLQPANSEMEPIYATDVQIQGKVVGVIRRLS
jgi:repressor LexA